MKYNWNQLTSQPALGSRPVGQTNAAERPAAQRAQAIRASANWLYMRGELARAAQLFAELQMRGSQA
jgi:hypothetical protein